MEFIGENITLGIFASVLFVSAHFLRALRLYIVLGALPKTWLNICFAHFFGVSLGYVSFALSYELIVILICSHLQWRYTIAILYSLIILRFFDAQALLIFALIASPMYNIRILSLILVIIVLATWLSIYGTNPMLSRLEQKILQIPHATKWDSVILRCSYSVRSVFRQLYWFKKGTLSLVVSLLLISWILEWSALFLMLGGVQQASASILERVENSLRLHHLQGYSITDYLMVSIYVTTSLLFLHKIARKILKEP